jgi:hypothetical protein
MHTNDVDFKLLKSVSKNDYCFQKINHPYVTQITQMIKSSRTERTSMCLPSQIYPTIRRKPQQIGNTDLSFIDKGEKQSQFYANYQRATVCLDDKPIP